MLSNSELRYTLALQRVPNLGGTIAKKLLMNVGSAEGVFKEKKSNLIKIDGVGVYRLKELSKKLQLDEADAEIRFIKQHAIEYSFFQDKSYPETLKYCIDGPILLFHRGNIDLQNKKLISIVGTRNITSYGRIFCEKLIESLSPLNPVIVSGFAYGVDITAHRAAMANGLQTIACLAHGLNQLYPKTHKKYKESIEENGGFFTEFWSSDAFERNNFLKRNRIIAGMTLATIVIESAEKGGSLVTADIANSYNRDVFALPGRATDSQSQGCNNLIKTQQAHLITSAADIIYLLGWNVEEEISKSLQTKLFIELNEEEKLIFNFLKDKDKQHLDTISIACKLPTYKISTLLLDMELKGIIRPLPGKLYQVV